jgi:cell division protein FtsX
MKYLYSFLLFILLLSFSCNTKPKVNEVANLQDSVVVDDRISNQLGETLVPKAKEDVSKWSEYERVDEFILKFYSVSAAEALSNAQELADLVQLMKDSIRVEKLKDLSVKARINVLHNETLRLADMASIPSIKKEEVKEEVGKILALYAAINSKINTIYKSEEIQNSLEFDTEIPVIIEDERKNDSFNRMYNSVQ